MGLQRVAEADWLWPKFDRAARVVDDADVIVLPQAEAAAREAADLVGADDLAGAARMTWEDLCLVELIDGVPMLTAGAVAHPTDWRLADKIGRSMAAVHAPIHGYADQLSAGVDHFMRTLAPGAIFGRANLFVVASDALPYLPTDDSATRFAHVTPDNAGATLFARCERQTLRRLPETGAILFTIGIAVAPLGQLQRDTVARIAAATAATPEDEAARRAAPGYAAALAAYASV